MDVRHGGQSFHPPFPFFQRPFFFLLFRGEIILGYNSLKERRKHGIRDLHQDRKGTRVNQERPNKEDEKDLIQD